MISFGLFRKLLETKSTDRKQTLLHFIVDIIHQKYPELRSFHNELQFTDKASQGTCVSACLPPSLLSVVCQSVCQHGCTVGKKWISEFYCCFQYGNYLTKASIIVP